MLVIGGDIFQLIAPFVACVWLFSSYRSQETQERIFWLILSLGCFSYFIGQGIWNYYELILQVSPPFPGWPDVFWIIQYALYLLAFLFRMYTLRHTFFTLRFFFDIVIVMIVVTTVSWDLIIQPMLSLSIHSNTILFTLTYIGYPIGDLALLICALSLLLIGDETIPRKAIFPLIIGFLIKVFANTGYAYLVIKDSYETGSFLDPLWSFSLLLIGFSGLYAHISATQTIKQKNLPPFIRIHHFLPYLCMLFLFLFELNEHHQFFDATTIGLIITITLLVIRQIITLYNNEELLQRQKRLTEELVGKNLQLKSMNQSLSEKEQQITDIFDNLDAVIWSTDIRTNTMMISTGVEKIFGHSRQELLINPFLWKESIHPDDKDKVAALEGFFFSKNRRDSIIEYRLLHANDKLKWIQVRRTPIFDEMDKLIKVHAVITDVTVRKKAEETIQYMAYHDELTGLPNRNLFYDYLKQEMVRAKNHHKKMALVFIDLDRFKNVNDTLGHYVGESSPPSGVAKIKRLYKRLWYIMPNWWG